MGCLIRSGKNDPDLYCKTGRHRQGGNHRSKQFIYAKASVNEFKFEFKSKFNLKLIGTHRTQVLIMRPHSEPFITQATCLFLSIFRMCFVYDLVFCKYVDLVFCK